MGNVCRFGFRSLLWFVVFTHFAATLIYAQGNGDVRGTFASKGATISRIVTSTGNNTGNRNLNSQMAFSTDGKTLYVANMQQGIFAYDYSVGSLSNERRIWQNSSATDGLRGSLGLAVHHDSSLGRDVLYFPEAVGFRPGFDSAASSRIQSVRRIADNDGDGNWAEAGELNQDILNNVQVTLVHQINQLQFQGDSLFLATGSQTVPGNNETALTGNINWIPDVTQIGSGSNAAGLDTPSGNGMGQDGYHLDERPFTFNPQTDPGMLQVYSTGQRNSFGIAFEGLNRDGDLWLSMNQQEAPVEERDDEIHRTFYQADHGFRKQYEIQGDNSVADRQELEELADMLGQGNNVPENQSDPILFDDTVDWKTNSTALAAGFFDPSNSVDPSATFDSSPRGIEFIYSTDAELNGLLLVNHFGSLRLVNVLTGESEANVIGDLGGESLDVLRTPDGNLLVTGQDDIFFVSIPGAVAVPEPSGGLLVMLFAAGIGCLRNRRS